LRILQISSARSFGGGERHLVDLTNALTARGHEVYAVLRKGSPLQERLSPTLSDRTFFLPIGNALGVRGAFHLSRIIRRHKIEIVHAHMARDYPIAALATARAESARLVLTRHVLFPLGRLHRYTAARTSRIIAVSAAVARNLTRQGIFLPEQISEVPNGLDFGRDDEAMSRFDRQAVVKSLGLPGDALLVSTVGELNPLKGHEEFLRAAAEVASVFPTAHFMLVGEDRSGSDYLSQLKTIASDMGLNSRVHFPGWVSDLPSLLLASDVFISASHTESFGLAILEAMACGRAVVATRTDGAQELINDGETGLLVNIGDVHGLASATLTLLADGEQRRELGDQAAQRARADFGLDRMVERTLQVYHEALTL
jgi:glycosyltransferase involved in cell wall biosynthesis